jgi:tRNA pseudouridine55 synthase
VSREPFGFINAFKPPGPSSAAFGSWVKWRLGAAAIGHWGTLDPTACGVLVLAVGKATKLLPLLTDDRKRYVFELMVGSRTDSGDASGRVTERAFVPGDWQAALTEVIPTLVGPLEQVPPMHSARKVGGRPLYASARRGEQIVRAPRTVTIHDLHLIACEPERARLDVTCSAGTYVRTLCEEIGRRCGLPAHMGALVRVAAGRFALRDAIRPDRIDAQPSSCLIDPATVLDNATLELDDDGARRFAHGGEVRLVRGDGATKQTPRATVLVTHANALVGYGCVVQVDDVAVLEPVHVFTQAGEGNGRAAENG